MKLPACLVAILAAASLASAASVPRMSFEHVVRSSQRAVRGVVTRSWSTWDAGRTAIWTHYEIRVAETLRGAASATLTISEPGGEFEGVAMRVPGAPRFAVGEEAVVFAYPTPMGYWRVRGWGQGRFRIDKQSGRRLVRATAQAAALPSTSGGEDLDSFLERVRALIRLEETR